MPYRAIGLPGGCLLLTLFATTRLAAATACLVPGQWAVPETNRAAPLPADRALAQLARAQVVLLGESHEDRDHHRWQLQTIAGLYALRSGLTLGFEMFPRRVQPVLDRWVAGELPEAEFLAQSDWQRVWGMDASLYLPLFHFARLNRIPMLALNVERSLVRWVDAEGWAAIPPAEREGVTDPAPARPEYLEQLYQAFVEHQPGGTAQQQPAAGAERSDRKFRQFVESMLVWDRAMAQALADRLRNAGPLVVGIMGSGHVRDGDGVPRQLRDLGVTAVATALPWDARLPCDEVRPTLATALFAIGATPEGVGADRPRLGIAIQAAEGGVRVQQVESGSVAEQAGLQVGDLIAKAAGEPVREPADLIATVSRQPPGTWLPLLVQRGTGQPVEVVARFPARQ
ncbi:MAG TPA: ChaN family lipoprotein [Candidatus Sulfotelmatobacter sp.]|nr:ChaN family lipoprotein [Candidatus Sulfotelmatobacter sp.]